MWGMKGSSPTAPRMDSNRCSRKAHPQNKLHSPAKVTPPSDMSSANVLENRVKRLFGYKHFEMCAYKGPSKYAF